jgi:hypothetical protein
MGSLTKEQLLGKRKRKVLKVPLPVEAINGADHVYVRQVSAAQMKTIGDLGQAVQDGSGDATEAVVTPFILGVCDEKGARLFDEDDREAIGSELEFPVLQRCLEALMELNELTEEGEKERKND